MNIRERKKSKGQRAKEYSNMYAKDSTTEKLPRILSKRYWSERNHLTITGVLAILFLIDVTLVNANVYLDFGDNISNSWNVPMDISKLYYVVIIDAGSTGSRVLAFKFRASTMNRRMILVNETFHEVKPGLSYYKDRPKDVKQSLDILLQKAKSEIPVSEWANTPLKLKATAGLRLLPTSQSQALLDESKRILKTSGFKVSEDAATIMSGIDEGLFSWFTSNFLLSRFPILGSAAEYATNTVGALDLGGASTQITFGITPIMIEKQSEQLAIHKKYLYNIKVFDREITVFTRSFLGLGLMAARKAILTHSDNYQNKSGKPNFSPSSSGVIELHSECVNPAVSGEKWKYDGKNYLVKGPLNDVNSDGTDKNNSVFRFSNCVNIIKKVVNSLIHDDLPVIEEHDLYGFSYYFERAADAGIIDRIQGGIITFEMIQETARKICESPNTDHPLMCLDMTYIYVLLQDGLNLHAGKHINLKKKINGYEVSWGLGAAYLMLQEIF